MSKNDDTKRIKTLVPMLFIGLIVSSIIALTSNLFIMSFLFIFIGFSTTTVGIGTQTIIQLEVDDLYRARVLTWWSSTSFGALTIGGILLGSIGEFIPLSYAMFIMPIIGFLIFKLVIFYKFKNNFI
jgi:hypothetical protein